MSTRSFLTGGLALLAALAFSPGAGGAPQAGEKKPAGLCADCHDQAKTFQKTAHGRSPKLTGNAACESCHGDGAKHMEAGGDKSEIQGLHGREGAAACLKCHDKATPRTSFRTGVHAGSATVNCLSCHSVHSGDAKAGHLLKAKDPALCAACHETAAASFREKPFAHKVGRGAMGCTSCHDPHGRAGREGLRLTRGAEMPCVSCHSEKSGAFVFEHFPAGTGDCTKCHEAHGSSNPKRLTRSSVQQLCLECHSDLGAGTLGSRPPAFHNLLTARYRNCTTCHVAIHGSNRSPQLLK